MKNKFINCFLISTVFIGLTIMSNEHFYDKITKIKLRKNAELNTLQFKKLYKNVQPDGHEIFTAFQLPKYLIAEFESIHVTGADLNNNFLSIKVDLAIHPLSSTI